MFLLHFKPECAIPDDRKNMYIHTYVHAYTHTCNDDGCTVCEEIAEYIYIHTYSKDHGYTVYEAYRHTYRQTYIHTATATYEETAACIHTAMATVSLCMRK